MTSPSPPSANPADKGSLAGAIKFALVKYAQNTDDMLPAKVLSYDRTTNRAKVVPLIPFITTGNEIVQRAIIASVPVFQMGSGGFVISFPMNAGDLCWIKANDRDISLFKQLLGPAAPPTQRKHTFEDAMVFPDTMFQGVNIAEEDNGHLVIQNLAGTVKISWWANLLKIIAPGLGIGGTPDPNAIIDVQSTTKASMIFPRMTQIQRDAIPSPQEGMIIWNLTTHGLSSYNGSTWS